VTERFTRTDPENLKYKITINDPETWTKPWSLMIPLQRTSDSIFEYACQEGNIGLTGILAGAPPRSGLRNKSRAFGWRPSNFMDCWELAECSSPPGPA
jgi:hypothetical protein